MSTQRLAWQKPRYEHVRTCELTHANAHTDCGGGGRDYNLWTLPSEWGVSATTPERADALTLAHMTTVHGLNHTQPALF